MSELVTADTAARVTTFDSDNVPRDSDDVPPIDPLVDFPGCDPVPLAWEELEQFDGHIFFWDGDTDTAWTVRDGGPPHEMPISALAEILTRMSLERGSPIRNLGGVFVARFGPDGRPRRMMAADHTIYLQPSPWLTSRRAIVVGEDPLPDVVVEVDYTTDVRRAKLALYAAWGLPEVWVDVPDAPSPSRPSTLKVGTTIHVLENGRYREVLESRAFPTWKAASIHAMINEARLSDATLAELARVGRMLGAREGTTPNQDPQIGAHRREAYRHGRREGRARGLAEALTRERQLLHRLAQRKYDADVAGRLAELLDGVAVPERLADVGDWIIDCDDGEDLLARLSGAEPTRGELAASSVGSPADSRA